MGNNLYKILDSFMNCDCTTLVSEKISHILETFLFIGWFLILVGGRQGDDLRHQDGGDRRLVWG